MFAYLIRCFVVLIGLWAARHFHWIPWNDLINLCLIVIVPMLIAAGAWRTSKQTTLRYLANGLGVDLDSRQSGRADQDRHQTSP